MKILVVGNGGREHALLWKLRADNPDAELFVARGNGGTDALATCLPLEPTDAPAIAAWADAHNVDLTVVGPESALDAGIGDLFERNGRALFGPTRAAAAIETSKAYAKQLMQRAGVPTPAFKTFTELEPAEQYIRKHENARVVKASGLAAGKGAVVCDSADEAVRVARAMLEEHVFGTAGMEIVVEDRITGEELSILAITDGTDVVPLIPAQDHKRIGEGDTGANTGGMGVYAPVSIATPELIERVRGEIFLPTLAALRKDNRTFRGLLYAGLMVSEEGPRVIEFNARFGDPETQAVLPLLQSSLLDLLLEVARGGSIANVRAQFSTGAALTTVIAARGYPDAPETGKPITIPHWVDDAHDVLLFHAGTRNVNGVLETSGGRVMAATGLGANLTEAAQHSRRAAEDVQF
ncbi:MAG TPA: phosphoribosylamine--glycine ligase, partial [Longimicrobiales bacterium]